MRSIDLRVPLIAGAAVLLLAFTQAKAATPPVAAAFAADTVAEQGADDDRVAAPLAFGSEPVSDSSDAAADMLAMSEKLSDPRMQDGVATMVERMTGSMLDLPIGQFVAAIEKSMPGKIKGGKRIRATDTVADLAGRDADRLPGELASGSRQMMGMMSGFAAAFATLIPEFEKLGHEMEKGFATMDDASRTRD